MKTICPNLECLQVYHVKSEALGKLTRCKQCNTVFTIEAMPDPIDVSELFAGEDAEAIEEEVDCVTSGGVGTVTRKKTTQEVIADKIREITQVIGCVAPDLDGSYKRMDNESDTRAVIDRILKEVLGYSEENIQREYKVYNNKIDYVLSIKGENCLLVEAKAIHKPLRSAEIAQATSYGVLAGIKWVVLTNGLVWMLYRISDDPKSSHDLVFSVDLIDGLDEEEASHLYLISKHGMCRKHLLEKRWQKISALSPENLTAAILSEEVINKIRITLTAQTGYKVSNEEIKQTLLSRNLID